MSATTTRAPSSANPRAGARPMPEEPPVMTAVRSARRPGMAWLPVLGSGSVMGVEDVLDLGEAVRCVGAQLTAQAGLLEPAEGRPVAHRRVRVDAQVAGLHGSRDPQRAPEVARVDRAGEPEVAVVGQPHRVRLVVEG